MCDGEGSPVFLSWKKFKISLFCYHPGIRKQDPRTKPKALLKLLEAAEKAKKQLSPVGVTDAPMNIECLWEDVSTANIEGLRGRQIIGECLSFTTYHVSFYLVFWSGFEKMSRKMLFAMPIEALSTWFRLSSISLKHLITGVNIQWKVFQVVSSKSKVN